jgi:hypothetical protein
MRIVAVNHGWPVFFADSDKAHQPCNVPFAKPRKRNRIFERLRRELAAFSARKHAFTSALEQARMEPGNLALAAAEVPAGGKVNDGNGWIVGRHKWLSKRYIIQQ